MNKPECKTYPNGDKVWYLNGKHHREDGPAVEDADGTKKWFLNDKLHREDGPASFTVKMVLLLSIPTETNVGV